MKTNNKQNTQYASFEAALKTALSPEARTRVDADKAKRKLLKDSSVSGRASRDKAKG